MPLPPYFDPSHLPTFEFKSGDIIISSGAKSGLHWTKHQVSQLLAEAPEPNPQIGDLVPWLDWRMNPTDTNEERTRVLNEFDWSKTKGRRIFCTHTPFGPDFPIPFREDVKYIVSGRNPFDLVISAHHFIQDHNDEFFDAWGLKHLKLPFEELFEALLTGQLPILMFMETVWKYRHHKNVFMVHYADMRKDLPSHLKKLSEFLEVSLDPQTMDKVIERCSFEWMRQFFDTEKGIGFRKPDGTVIPVFLSREALLRKGAVNDQHEKLTPEMRQRLEEALKQRWPPELYQWMLEGGPLP